MKIQNIHIFSSPEPKAHRCAYRGQGGGGGGGGGGGVRMVVNEELKFL